MHGARVTSLMVVSLVLAACSENSPSGPDDELVAERPPAATAGTIEVSITTTGRDQDADGFILSVTNPSSHQFALLPLTGKYTITVTEPGQVTLVLYGLANNCKLAGLNPRIVNVNAGEIAAVSYGVDCVASGSLRVTTLTTGVDPDIDGYLMWDQERATIQSDLSHSFTAGLDTGLPLNGTTVLRALTPGTYRILIQSVAPNCSVSASASEAIRIVAGVETSLTLQFTCMGASQIAFVRGAGEFEWEAANIANTDIYVVNSSGTGTIRLTAEPGADINPAWSPDGRKIAFASDRAGDREIYVMNADGTEPIRLTNSIGADYAPAYSPDGKRIAFVSERDGNAEIYIMNVDGTDVSRLTNDGSIDTDPAFSPDGRITFAKTGAGIYEMNADGSGATRRTSWGDAQPAWSPDGKTLAFMRNGREIWLMNTDNSELRQFFDWDYSRGHPEWSPEAKLIAFDDRDCWDYGPCPRGIVVATAEGQYSITIDDASEPAWKPR